MDYVHKDVNARLNKRGFYCCRENFMFGQCGMYKKYNADSSDRAIIYVLFVPLNEDIGQWRMYTWTALKEYLRRCWRPVASDEVDWYLQNVAA